MKRLTLDEFVKGWFDKNMWDEQPRWVLVAKSIAQSYADHCEESAWISVEDALPKFNERVLVEYKPDHPVMEGVLIGIDERLDVTNSSLPVEIKRRIMSRSGFKALNVMRWRPLPKPPKQ